MLRRTAGQLLLDWSNIHPRYLNTSTPSMRSASSSPVKLDFASKHLVAIATSLLRHLIWVFLLQRAILLCLMSRPSVMCIPHKSQQVSGSAPSCTTATLNQKCSYMKFSQSLPALLCLSKFNTAKIVTSYFHVDDSSEIRYNMIIDVVLITA